MHKRLIQLIKILDRVTPGASRSLGWEFLVTVLSFPASILLNRTLGAEDRGLLALVTLVPTTVFALGTCQWDRLLTGLITSKQISSKEAWRRTVYYTYYLSFIFIPVGIIISLTYAKLPIAARELSIVYSLNFPTYFLAGCLATIFIAAGNIDIQYAMKMSFNCSYLFLIFTLLISKNISVSTIILNYIISNTVCLVVGWIKKEKSLSGAALETRPPIKVLIRSFFPYLLETFSSKLDIWAFSILSSSIVLGQYTGITSMMLPVSFLSNALTNSSTAHLDWTQPIVIQRYLLKTAIVFLGLLAGLIVGGILLGPYLLIWVLGDSFRDGVWMIPWIAMVVVSQAAALQFHTALQLSGLQNAYLTIQSLEPVVRLIIILALGWKLAEFGILVGMVISSILKVFVCFWFQHTRIKQKIPS